MVSTICKCGHVKTGHIYHTGACRTGIVCTCKQFQSEDTVEVKKKCICDFLAVLQSGCKCGGN